MQCAAVINKPYCKSVGSKVINDPLQVNLPPPCNSPLIDEQASDIISFIFLSSSNLLFNSLIIN